MLILASYIKTYYFCNTLKHRSKQNGFLAQLVEQWIENPCVPGSIPGETTRNKTILTKPLKLHDLRGYFLILNTVLFRIIKVLLSQFSDGNTSVVYNVTGSGITAETNSYSVSCIQKSCPV